MAVASPPTTGTRRGPGRDLGLDILRAVAILLVLGHHAPFSPSDRPILLRAPLFALLYGGWCGVDLFFVLSGFLVSGLLFTEFKAHGRISPGRFLIRRGFKIYPQFYIYIILLY
ncbi:MAG: acyltransferase, partial [Isosphaeraceae bacterium]|nr:acyltransferase [Isosphaeraceae bacterium]